MNTIVTFVGGNRITKALIFCNSSFYSHNEACVAAMLKIKGPGVWELCNTARTMSGCSVGILLLGISP